MPPKDFQTFEEFWPHYVKEHSQPATRKFHAVGTTAGLALAIGLLAARKWKYLPLALIPGYGAAWISHFFIEQNKPATFDHPLWSLQGDCKMLGMMFAGSMDEEVERVLRDGRVSDEL